MTDKRHELNTKFTILTGIPKEELSRIQNQKVMDVEEYNETGAFGEFKAWRGSTELAYFYIVFMKGVVTVILEEREMLIGTRITTYATLTKVTNEANKPDPAEWFIKYNTTEYKDDLKTLKFKDVMVSLKWKFHSKKVKVKAGITFPLG
jgi:hypothetical protein